jgi:hypothetical protein
MSAQVTGVAQLRETYIPHFIPQAYPFGWPCPIFELGRPCAVPVDLARQRAWVSTLSKRQNYGV